MGIGCLQHEQAQGILPAGGWGWHWAGDPDRGFGLKQPSGWHYNILPYIDNVQLHDIGKYQTYSALLGRTVATAADKAQALEAAVSMPVALYNCPTRRKLMAWPAPSASDITNINISATTPLRGRSDYAGCGGSNYPGDVNVGPGSLAAGDALTDCGNGASTDWSQFVGTRWAHSAGVFYKHSVTKLASIRHGTSCTYLIGERYTCPDHYFDGGECSDDQGWNQGWDFDTIRWTGEGWYDKNGNPQYDASGNPLPGANAIPAPGTTSSTPFTPMRDTPGVGGCDTQFGSAHADGFNMVTCDGAVHKVSYNISQDVHRRYGDCIDKTPVDMTQIR